MSVASGRRWSGRAHRARAGLVDVHIDPRPFLVEIASLNVPVTVAEDEGGEHLGWIEAGREDHPPVMIKPERLFPVQFVYGVQSAVDCGRGAVVRLKVFPT